MAKLNNRCFCYLTTAMSERLGWAPTWRRHTKFYKFGWNTFSNNARMIIRTDLNLCGVVVYISIMFHVAASRLNLLAYDFYFWWSVTANQALETSSNSLKNNLLPCKLEADFKCIKMHYIVGRSFWIFSIFFPVLILSWINKYHLHEMIKTLFLRSFSWICLQKLREKLEGYH